MSKSIKFVIEKEVKNSVRFKEVTESGEAPVLGSLYVQKWYIKDCTELTVTLTTPKDP
jgi:Flp pilus assembly secretin CpaC